MPGSTWRTEQELMSAVSDLTGLRATGRIAELAAARTRPEPFGTRRTLIIATAHRRAAATNSPATADRTDPLPRPHIAPEQPATTAGTLHTADVLEELIPSAR